MAKLNLKQSLLQFSVSHDPLEIILICWFAAQKSFNQCWKQLPNIIVETDTFHE